MDKNEQNPFPFLVLQDLLRSAKKCWQIKQDHGVPLQVREAAEAEYKLHLSDLAYRTAEIAKQECG